MDEDMLNTIEEKVLEAVREEGGGHFCLEEI